MRVWTIVLWIMMTGFAVSSTPVSLCASQLAINGSWIVDSGGRRLEVEKSYDRIISLYGAHTENIFSMGAEARLIGVTPNDDWPPAVKAKPVHSYHDGLEKFLAARPDLVLIRPMIDRGYAQLIRRLEAHGIVVISLQPSTLDQMFDYWRILGRLTGHRAEAEQMITRFKQTAERIHRHTASIRDKKRVYFEAIHDRMRTFAPGATAIFVLETAGGINVAADAAPRRNTNIADYGKERILSHADSIDVYLAQFGPMNQPTNEMIKAEPGFSLIHAVQRDQIYFIDEKLVSRPTLRLLTGICSIGQILYPDVFSGRAEPFGCPPWSSGYIGDMDRKETSS